MDNKIKIHTVGVESVDQVLYQDSKPEVGKIRPAGRMRHARRFYAARRQLQKNE